MCGAHSCNLASLKTRRRPLVIGRQQEPAALHAGQTFDGTRVRLGLTAKVLTSKSAEKRLVC